MLKARLFGKFKKAVSLGIAVVFAASQPVWANPSLLEKENLTADAQNQAGFADAAKAEQSYQNQLNEVERMKALLNDQNLSNLTEEQRLSLLQKFQNTEEEEKLKEALADEGETQEQISQELATEKLNTQVELAMLKLDMAPEAAPVFIEPAAAIAAPEPAPAVEPRQPVYPALKQIEEQEALRAEQEKIQAVPQAELELTGTLFVQSEPSPEDQTNALAAASTAVPQIQSSLQDPPVVIFPIPEPTIPFTPGLLLPDGVETDPDEPETDQVGGFSLFGDLLQAIRTMIFADTNKGNGKAIGDGVNDKVAMLSSFMVMFFKFFGFEFGVNQIRDLILKGTTQSGMELFGISAGDEPPVVPLILLFSSFVLATSAFFPQKGRTGLDVADIRSRKADAFKITLPIIIPHALLTSLGLFLDPTATDAAATAAGRAAIAAGIASFLSISLSLKTPTDGKPLKIFDPNGEAPGEFATTETLNLSLPPEAIQFFFDAESTPGASESVLALLQAMNADGTFSQTGLFGLITIDLGSIVNQIGDFITRAFTQNLGDVLAYYKRLGFETGASPFAPPPALPLLLMLGFGFHQPGGSGSPTLNASGNPFMNELFFPLMLALPLIFTLSRPPIPDISNPDPNSTLNKNIHKVFFENAQERFEELAKEAQEGKKKETRKPVEEKKKAKKAPAKRAAGKK